MCRYRLYLQTPGSLDDACNLSDGDGLVSSWAHALKRAHGITASEFKASAKQTAKCNRGNPMPDMFGTWRFARMSTNKRKDGPKMDLGLLKGLLKTAARRTATGPRKIPTQP